MQGSEPVVTSTMRVNPTLQLVLFLFAHLLTYIWQCRINFVFILGQYKFDEYFAHFIDVFVGGIVNR